MPGALDQSIPAGINPGLLSAGNLVNANAPATMSPSAIQAMSDSMRSGALTAQDVVDRLGELGKTARKAQIEVHKREIADLQDPELVAAKHAITLAGGQQAQLQGATAQASMPNVPLAADTQAAQLKAALWDAQLHGAGLGQMQDVLMKSGWAVPSAGAAPTGDTQNEIVRRYQGVLQHQQEMAHAQDFLAKTDKTEMTPISERDAQGNEVTIQKPTITYGGRIYDPSTRDAVQKFVTDPTNQMPSTWDSKGRPMSPSKGSPTPDASATPVSVEPITGTPAPLTPGSVTPNGGIVTKREVPIQDSPEKVLKDVQAKASYQEWDKSLKYVDLMARRNLEAQQAATSGAPKKVQNEKDIALIESAIKLYDPQGVLREFKFAKTSETRPLDEYIRELVPLVTGQQILTSGQRERLTSMANDIIGAQERGIRPDLQRIAGVEKQWGRPVLNSRERAIAEGTSSIPTAAPAPSQTQTKSLNGRQMISADGGKSWNWVR